MSKKLHFVASQPQNLPKEFWISQIPQLSEYEIVDVEIGFENLKNHWKEMLASSNGILFERSVSGEVLKLLKGVPRLMGELQCIDVLSKDSAGNWWPECYFREILLQAISKAAPNLDTSASAYITGEGALMRVGMSALVQMGYRRINLVLENPENYDFLSDAFKRLFFDTEIILMKNTDLTLQKNDGTILINTLKLAEHPELSDDLTYLNFIFGAGLVVDTQGDILTNTVLDEAQHVGLRVLPGHLLQAQSDWQVLTKILGKLPLASEDFIRAWSAYVQQNLPRENPAEGPVTK